MGDEYGRRLALGSELHERLLVDLVVVVLECRPGCIGDTVGVGRKLRHHRVTAVAQQHRLDVAAELAGGGEHLERDVANRALSVFDEDEDIAHEDLE